MTLRLLSRGFEHTACRAASPLVAVGLPKKKLMFVYEGENNDKQ